MIKIYKDKNYRYFNILGIKLKFLRSKSRKAREQILDELTNSHDKINALNALGSLPNHKIQALRYISSIPMSSLEQLASYARMLKCPAINRDKVSSQVENINQMGIIETPRKPQRLIVSLTSYPARLYDIHLCLYSLLNQNVKPDKLILWLAEEQFPNREADIPNKVLALRQWGLEIHWCPDYRSFKKLIPALELFPDDVIVTADDDLYYSPDWLGKLWNAYQHGGPGVYAHRCHKINIQDNKVYPYSTWKKCISDASSFYSNFPTTGGGVLYAPHAMCPDVVKIEQARKLCPNADDIWLWGMCVLAECKITLVESPENQIRFINPVREVGLNSDGTLFSSNKNANDEQLYALLDKYPIIRERLIQEYTNSSLYQ